MEANPPESNPPERLTFTVRWRVRVYELDVNGHVNNAVYLNWAEQAATDHTDAYGFGRDWALAHGGAWVVRRHEVTYHRPAVYGDEVEVTTQPQLLRGARGLRQTTMRRVADGTLLAEVLTEWVWVRLPDGRPARVPEEIVRFFSPSAAPAAPGASPTLPPGPADA